MNKRIPIKAARELAKKYKLDQVIIVAYERDVKKQEHMTHVVTYGKSKVDCLQAAQGGNMVKKALGWPESLCNTRPRRAEPVYDDAMAERIWLDPANHGAQGEAGTVRQMHEDSLLVVREVARERDALAAALRNVADFSPPNGAPGWCWCGEEEFPETHFPYCEKARATLTPAAQLITTDDAERARYSLLAGRCLCGQTVSVKNKNGIWVWPKGHAGYWTEDGCRENE
jgi:hypothetical protein